MATDASMPVKITAKQSVFKGFFEVSRFQLQHQLFAGGMSKMIQREVFLRGAAAGILLIDVALQKVVLVEQFRCGAMAAGAQRPWLIELVAGIIEPGELPAEVVSREAIEEAGCAPLTLEPMYEYWTSPGGSDEKMHLFWGTIDSTQVSAYGGLETESEDIKVHVVSFSDVFSWLENGKIDNAMTLIAIQWLYINHQRLVLKK
ncbi:NUDIX domain-containing protein [Pleionea sp. CnH1-48]|uniref:NUDIX domain-containing protein n=1 Tax=Pleionea sp. CnH1-48 TaxID=2954494 RepID=UPI002097E65D|nr:NUDIX domain-containing protein [Pleionea sp. CnH1-48]MCO7227407.1 NUDIX domain-containing protein [Pleionea sp. CnH1-48]